MKKLLATLLLTTGFLFAAEEVNPSNDLTTQGEETTNPVRATLTFPKTTVQIPVLQISEEENRSLAQFLNGTGNEEAAIALVNVTNDIIKDIMIVGSTSDVSSEQIVTASDYIKYLRIVDHFEDPKGIIRNISDEEQRDPEKLASALKINLSYIYFKAGDNNFFEIPVRSLSPLEHRGYMVFWRSKNLDRARQLVQTASDFLTSETIPGADFLKFLRIADRYPTAEAAQKIFNGINKADIDNDPEKLASTLGMHLSYYVLKFQGLNDVEIPTTELTAEEIQQYQGFFSLIPPQKAIQLIDAAKTRVTTSLISGTDFLKFIKIIDRFASIKTAEEAISGVATEIQNDPEKLARAFGFDLSHQIMRIPGQAPVEMPVQALTRTEVHAYQNFMGRQEMELIPGLITTARGMLTVSDVTAETFLKFMRVFERFPTIEAAQQELNRLAAERFPTIQAEEAFNRLVKEEIDNDPEKLAKAFAFELSHMFIKFPKVGSI